MPTHLNFLTVDDSFGNMPAQVPNEVIPHILEGRRDAPDSAGPFVWVYPFDEYHDWAYQDQQRSSEIFSGDWVIRQAINDGFPLNTVVSTTALLTAQAKQPDLFAHTVLVTIAPAANSDVEAALIRFVQQGGDLLVYGPITRAGPAFLDLLNLAIAEPLEGVFDMDIEDLVTGDTFTQVQNPGKIRHVALINGGGVEPVVRDRADATTRVLAAMKQGDLSRDVLVARSRPEWNGGKVIYFRGTNSNRYTGGRLLTPDNPEEFFHGPLLMRYVLSEFGYTFLQTKLRPAIKTPVVCVARSNNGFYFSGYTPDTTVKQRFRFPQGCAAAAGLRNAPRKWLCDLPPAARLAPRVPRLRFPTHRRSRRLQRASFEREGCRSASGGRRADRRHRRVLPRPGGREENIRVYLNASYPWRQGRTAFQKGPAVLRRLQPSHQRHRPPHDRLVRLAVLL